MDYTLESAAQARRDAEATYRAGWNAAMDCAKFEIMRIVNIESRIDAGVAPELVKAIDGLRMKP